MRQSPLSCCRPATRWRARDDGEAEQAQFVAEQAQFVAEQAQFVAERAGLSARLNALARLVQIGAARRGRDGFSEDLLAESEATAHQGWRAADAVGRAHRRVAGRRDWQRQVVAVQPAVGG